MVCAYQLLANTIQLFTDEMLRVLFVQLTTLA